MARPSSLKRMSDIARALNLSLRYTYVLSSADSAFPPVVERIGVTNFYKPADVVRYARSRKSQKRWGMRDFDFG